MFTVEKLGISYRRIRKRENSLRAPSCYWNTEVSSRYAHAFVDLVLYNPTRNAELYCNSAVRNAGGGCVLIRGMSCILAEACKHSHIASKTFRSCLRDAHTWGRIQHAANCSVRLSTLDWPCQTFQTVSCEYTRSRHDCTTSRHHKQLARRSPRRLRPKQFSSHL